MGDVGGEHKMLARFGTAQQRAPVDLLSQGLGGAPVGSLLPTQQDCDAGVTGSAGRGHQQQGDHFEPGYPYNAREPSWVHTGHRAICASQTAIWPRHCEDYFSATEVPAGGKPAWLLMAAMASRIVYAPHELRACCLKLVAGFHTRCEHYNKLCAL